MGRAPSQLVVSTDWAPNPADITTPGKRKIQLLTKINKKVLAYKEIIIILVITCGIKIRKKVRNRKAEKSTRGVRETFRVGKQADDSSFVNFDFFIDLIGHNINNN